MEETRFAGTKFFVECDGCGIPVESELETMYENGVHVGYLIGPNYCSECK